MKFGNEGHIYDGFISFEANFKSHIKRVVQVNQSTDEVECILRQLTKDYKARMGFI